MKTHVPIAEYNTALGAHKLSLELGLFWHYQSTNLEGEGIPGMRYVAFWTDIDHVLKILFWEVLKSNEFCIRQIIVVYLQSAGNSALSWKAEDSRYVVASISRLLKIIGLFCKRAL